MSIIINGATANQLGVTLSRRIKLHFQNQIAGINYFYSENYRI